MIVNSTKRIVVHFRTKSTSCSSFVFRCGEHVISYASIYKYLGLVLDEYLDYSVTVHLDWLLPNVKLSVEYRIWSLQSYTILLSGR